MTDPIKPPSPKNNAKLQDISDLYAQGVDLAELLLSAELIHDPDADPDAAPDADYIDEANARLTVHDGGDPDDGTIIDLFDPSGERCNDLGNARILVRLCGNDIRWCQAMPGEGWMLWDGAKWAPDTTRRVYRLADSVGEECRRRAPPEVGDLVTSKEEKKQNESRKKMLAHADKCESANGYRAMLEMLRSRVSIAVGPDAWDADPLIVNTPDSTYDLRRVRRYAPKRADLITRATSTGASTEDCPIWKAFLLQIMAGNQEMVDFLQRAAGYCLTGDTSEQCMFIAYGTGGNGKGVFLNTLKAIIGTYAQGAQVETFVDRKKGGIPNDLAALAGTRFVLCSEPDEGAPLAEGLIKTVTGQDTVTARFLNREFFDFIPQFKLWMMTNHKPPIKGTDKGIWRRLRLVPFTVSIPKAEQDRDLPTKLKAEYPAILAWMIEGLKLWKEHGLAPPAAVLDASEIYRQEMDVLADFLADRCDVSTLATCKNGALYASYAEWAKDNGLRPRPHKWLTQQLVGRGMVQDPDRSRGRNWTGLALRIEARNVGGMFGDRED